MKLYRYDSINCQRTVELRLRTFTVIKETPCGYWVSEWAYTALAGDANCLDKRWVSKTGRKRFCYTTKSKAMDSFLIRKRRHLDILTHQLKIAAIAARLDNSVESLPKPSELYFEEY